MADLDDLIPPDDPRFHGAEYVSAAAAEEYMLGPMTRLQHDYVMQTLALWVMGVFFAAGSVLGVIVAVEQHAAGYLVLVPFAGVGALMIFAGSVRFAASITMDEHGFSALTLGLRRKGWPWTETTVEHTENSAGHFGPVVSLRHQTNENERVYLRKSTGGYDAAMRFAVDHAERRVSYEAAVTERRKRAEARRRGG